jgi:rhodanese-related sulfurtransferase
MSEPGTDLDPPGALAALQADPELTVLDVRTVEEHESHRLPRSRLVPVRELRHRAGELDPEARWLVVCAHGVRSEWACALLRQLGFTHVLNLQGGLARWHACGLPLDR